MAVLTAQGISSLVTTLLVRSLVLPRTVARIPGLEFSGANGDTLTVRVRQPRVARTQANPGDPITVDPVNEAAVSVTVKHLYDASRLSDEDLTLNLEDFAGQVSAPQVASVAIGAEDTVAAEMNDLAEDATIEFPLAPDPAADEAVVLAARERLSSNDIPLGRRYFACAPDITTRLLAIEKFVKVNESGSPSALRDAVIGHQYGFTFVESSGLDAGTATAYHESGFAFTNRAPAIPRGAADAAATTVEGISLRQLFDFDTSILSDVSVVSAFAGCSVVPEDGDAGTDLKRAIKIGTAIA